MSDVTEILAAIDQGDSQASERLLPLVYEELRRLAAHRLAQERPGDTLQPTALVHEAYLRLVSPPGAVWNGRGHFFAAAAEAMRRILVNRARDKHRLKRGGDRQRLELNELNLATATENHDELLALHDALNKLETAHPTSAELVKLRFFAGLTVEQAAQALEISVRTADRHWAFARAWLYRACQE